ncbi:N-acetyltransferase family protein, partial [Streptomyces anulatus]
RGGGGGPGGGGARRVFGRGRDGGALRPLVHGPPRGGGPRGRGVASALLKALVDSTERAGIWTIQAGIFPENAASLAVHERAGFRVIGIRERIGRRRGVWRDVVLVERRSPAIT